MPSLIHYSSLPTERNNSASRRIDRIPVGAALRLINREDSKVAGVVKAALPSLEKAVRLVVSSLKKDGRLFFIGAGTSGRLGIMEAAECPPTFNTPPSLVQAFMAGGKSSVFRSKEGAEDRGEDGRRTVNKHVRKGDVVIGIAASGVTAFVSEGLHEARRKKAGTILITCHPFARKNIAHVIVALKTGPEIIAGSTRLKAATATKLALNSLTVASMVQLGKVYGNLMVDLQPRSQKLKARAINLISRLGKVSLKKAMLLLKKSGRNAKTAIVMARLGLSRAEAGRRLRRAEGHLYKVIGRE